MKCVHFARSLGARVSINDGTYLDTGKAFNLNSKYATALRVKHFAHVVQRNKY